MNEFELLECIPKNKYFSCRELVDRFEGESGVQRKLLNLERFGFLETEIRKARVLRSRFYKWNVRKREEKYFAVYSVKFYRRNK